MNNPIQLQQGAAIMVMHNMSDDDLYNLCTSSPQYRRICRNDQALDQRVRRVHQHRERQHRMVLAPQ